MTDDDRARGVIERREGATGLATGAKRPSFAVVGVARANRANGRRVDVPEMDDRERVSADADGWIDRDGSRRRRRRAAARERDGRTEETTDDDLARVVAVV